MRSVFLEGIVSEQLALDGLAFEFPNQLGSTKTAFGPNGTDPIGWLYVVELEEDGADDPDGQRGPYMIMADYSGRLWDYDAKQLVVDALRRVQARIGGDIRDYGN